VCVGCSVLQCDMITVYMRDSYIENIYICTARCTAMCDMTHSYVSHDIYICAHAYIRAAHIYMYVHVQRGTTSAVT